MPFDFFSLPQIVGYFAFVLTAIQFWQKNDKRFLTLNAIAACVWTLHYLLIGAWVGAALDVLVAIRSWLSARGLQPHHQRLNVMIFGSGFLMIGMVTYQHPYDILPTLACLVATYSTIYLHGFHLRYSMIVIISLWLAYNLLSHSIGGTATSITMLIVQIITLARMFRDKYRTAV